MSASDYAAVGGLALATLAGIYALMQVVVRGIVQELTPNSGKSLKDQVSRIEMRLDQLILELAKNAK